MNTRRHGLMRPGLASKVIAVLVVVGLVAGVAATYLAQAGLAMWVIALIVLLILGLPVLAVIAAGRE